MIRSGEFATVADIRRFQAEAETVAELDHPNIVPIYEVGEHDGYHLLQHEADGGGDPGRASGPVQSDPRVAARVIATLAGAILHAHRRGILHRDLKPSNILLDAQDEPMITDFGLAKRLDATIDLTVHRRRLWALHPTSPPRSRWAGRGRSPRRPTSMDWGRSSTPC